MCGIVYPWPLKLAKQKKIIALASIKREIRKVTLMVTWAWRTRSRVIVGVWHYIFLTSLTLKTCKTKKDYRSCVIRTRETEGHAHGHVTMTYKVTSDSWCLELCIFDISDPENLQNKKKIIALESIEQEIRKVTLMVTWPWRTRSRVIVGVWNYLSLTSLTLKTRETKKRLSLLRHKNKRNGGSRSWSRDHDVQGNAW